MPRNLASLFLRAASITVLDVEQSIAPRTQGVGR
jgi:hypothetical protein